jgi:hypothetical protein
MLLELGVKIRQAGLERLDLVEQSQDARPDGGRGRLPVRRRNAQWRHQLAHRGSMKQPRRGVKPHAPSQLPAHQGPERLRSIDAIMLRENEPFLVSFLDGENSGFFSANCVENKRKTNLFSYRF